MSEAYFVLHIWRLVLVALVTLYTAGSTTAQPAMLGDFTGHGDIGPVAHAGAATFNPGDQTYEIAGSGTNMWFGQDEFHFVWRKLKGDFILSAQASFVGTGGEPHRKLGWMVRSSLDPDAPYADAALHGNGLTSLQFRRQKGANTEEIKSPITEPNVIQLERHGDTFTMSVAKFGDPFTESRLANLNLDRDVYVGLFVCAHNAHVLEKGVFRNTRIVVPAKEGLIPYRDFIGSRLEIMTIESGYRQVVYESAAAIQAPNWTTDGDALIYNSNGRLYRFNLADRKVSLIDTGFATRNNNDHALSFDGDTLAISHHSSDHDNKSIIYTVPAAGGEPTLVTSRGHSYLHGWSPDGRYLVYTGVRGGEIDLYKIPVEGGDEIRLTTSPALDDGPEFSPDGRYIYFNSSRNGLMQIWRMRPDGSEQEQVTDDTYNNWFPHVSPDGRWIVFLSYSQDVDPDDHPFYKQVYLRFMPAAGGEPRVIAYVYGGQGTINVPSWSPDSKMIAFVSNSDAL
jgi:hypothetical protein